MINGIIKHSELTGVIFFIQKGITFNNVYKLFSCDTMETSTAFTKSWKSCSVKGKINERERGKEEEREKGREGGREGNT